MPCPICRKPTVPEFWPHCSAACKKPAPVRVNFACRWCKAKVSFMSDTNQAKCGVCSKSCYHKYDVNRSSAGEAMVNFLFKTLPHHMGELLPDSDLAAIGQTSKTLVKPAAVAQLGPWYGDHTAKHYDTRRGEVDIAPDKMVEIAVQSYRTATALAKDGLPVVLYRVTDKNKLTRDEEQRQTVAGAVKTDENLWPVERTAAWIQGAMRASVPFVLLTDPRAEGSLVGGKDKSSDAVYVRELFQISQSGYEVARTTEDDLPERMKDKGRVLFKMIKSGGPRGPMPLIPNMSAKMAFDNTWDSSKSSLSLKDDDTTSMASVVKAVFDGAGGNLGDISYG